MVVVCLPTPPSRLLCYGSPLRLRRVVMSRRCGALLSRRARWCGDEVAMDFWSSSSSATGWCLLQHHREEVGVCAGATAACRSWLAAAGRVMWFVLCCWCVAGRSAASPRHRRLESPDLEEEGEPGAGPRPARHSDMWALRCSIWWFTKLSIAMGLLLLLVCWSCCFPLRRFVAGVERLLVLLLPLAAIRRRSRAG